MKRITVGLLAVCLCLATSAFAAVPKPNHWYHKTDSDRWCADVNQKRWLASKANDSAEALIVDGKVQSLSLVSAGESGDWIFFDTYILTDGQVTGLDRQLNIFQGDLVAVFDHYVLKDGKLRRQSRRFGDPQKGPDKRKVKLDWEPEAPVVSKLSDFGFFPILLKTPSAKPVCTK